MNALTNYIYLHLFAITKAHKYISEKKVNTNILKQNPNDLEWLGCKQNRQIETLKRLKQNK